MRNGGKAAEPWQERPPASVITHASMEPHAMRTGAEPLLAAYLWRDHLHEPARLVERSGIAVERSMNKTAALINLSRYPLTEPDSPRLLREVESLRRDLQATGAAEAPSFLSGVGLERCIADAEALTPRQYKSVGEGSAYLEEPSPAWTADHPRAIRQTL